MTRVFKVFFETETGSEQIFAPAPDEQFIRDYFKRFFPDRVITRIELTHMCLP